MHAGGSEEGVHQAGDGGCVQAVDVALPGAPVLTSVDVTAQSEEEALKAMRSAEGAEDGDFPLSSEGERQAEALGAVWVV